MSRECIVPGRHQKLKHFAFECKRTIWSNVKLPDVGIDRKAIDVVVLYSIWREPQSKRPQCSAWLFEFPHCRQPSSISSSWTQCKTEVLCRSLNIEQCPSWYCFTQAPIILHRIVHPKWNHDALPQLQNEQTNPAKVFKEVGQCSNICPHF